MKFTGLFFFIFYLSLAYGQKGSPSWRPDLELLYGQKFLSQKSFDGQLNSINKLRFGGALSYAGISYSSYVLVSRGTFFDHYSNIYYTQVIPQRIRMYDSSEASITGFNFGFTIWGYTLLKKSNYFTINIQVGANTGRLRIYDNSLFNQKNPYFAPKIRLNPVLTFGCIRLALTGEYDYDISKKGWRSVHASNSEKREIPFLSQTGLSLFSSIGYVFSDAPRHHSAIKTE